MRKPTIQPPQNLVPDTPSLKPGEVRQERRYRLITPLFGGGVEPGIADPVTLIRGSSIRGQLRFWWRATRGGAFGGSLDAMKKRESEIWGAASDDKGSGPSQVQVEVRRNKDDGQAQLDHPFEVYPKQTDRGTIYRTRANRQSVVHPYAAFPLQPSDEDLKHIRRTEETKVVQLGVFFTLLITFPKSLSEDVEAALWAWETFGGIGGRTRRGFGALQLISINALAISPPASAKVKERIENGLTKYVVEGDTWPQYIPHLNQTMSRLKIVPRPPKKPQWDELDAWFDLIDMLSEFRQSRPGRGTNHPGRSKWPEPDMLRRSTGRSSAAHRTPLSSLDKAPRAVFGLPIVFHFKDRGDPNTTLQGAKFERLASPLILRPLACAGGEAVGIALVLNAPYIPSGDLALIWEDPTRGKMSKNMSAADVLLDASEAAAIAPLNSQPDVLQAFLDTL